MLCGDEIICFVEMKTSPPPLEGSVLTGVGQDTKIGKDWRWNKNPSPGAHCFSHSQAKLTLADSKKTNF